MERIRDRRPSGIGEGALRGWGLVFLAAGILGRGLIQTHILNMGVISTSALLEVINNSDTAMGLATVSLICQALETCAAPIYAFFLVQGMQHTSSPKNYFLRILGLALLSEIPYNLAFGGKLLELGSRNPVFGLALAMAAMLFYRHYSAPGFVNTAIKLVVTISAILWAQMLRVDHGAAMVLIVSVLWFMRTRPNFSNFAGCAAAVVGTVFSPFYMASPMGFLAVHMYNGERAEVDRKYAYLVYPGMLVLCAVAGLLLG